MADDTEKLTGDWRCEVEDYDGLSFTYFFETEEGVRMSSDITCIGHIYMQEDAGEGILVLNDPGHAVMKNGLLACDVLSEALSDLKDLLAEADRQLEDDCSKIKVVTLDQLRALKKRKRDG